jgi:hypothetical protein
MGQECRHKNLVDRRVTTEQRNAYRGLVSHLCFCKKCGEEIGFRLEPHQSSSHTVLLKSEHAQQEVLF